MEHLPSNDWACVLESAMTLEQKEKLFSFIDGEYEINTCYPPKEKIFAALNLTPLDSVKLVIIGQDPYHTAHQADGLAFSCADGKAQPSLKNIFVEMSNDLGVSIPKKYTLDGWARQGVLLLNTVLTVRQGVAGSHAKMGWETLTRNIVRNVCEMDRPIVFMLWGAQARQYADMIVDPKHLLLISAHPSPLSAYRGFFGNRHFSKCNNFLINNGVMRINFENN